MTNKFYQIKIKTIAEMKTNKSVVCKKDFLNNVMLYCLNGKDIFTSYMEECVSVDKNRLVDAELLEKNTYYEAETGYIYYPWMIDTIVKEISIL